MPDDTKPGDNEAFAPQSDEVKKLFLFMTEEFPKTRLSKIMQDMHTLREMYEESSEEFTNTAYEGDLEPNDKLYEEFPTIATGNINMPITIDTDILVNMYPAILYLADNFTTANVFIQGNGGSIWAMYSLIDAFNRLLPNAHYILTGSCHSAHAYLWLNMKNRFVTPNSTISLHKSVSKLKGWYDGMELMSNGADLRHLDKMLAERLAEITPYDAAHWGDIIDATSADSFHRVDAPDLIKMGTAKMWG
jgi:ATP-dependent protease ClpP protease subunit